jgi:hypothetical protein
MLTYLSPALLSCLVVSCPLNFGKKEKRKKKRKRERERDKEGGRKIKSSKGFNFGQHLFRCVLGH